MLQSSAIMISIGVGVHTSLMVTIILSTCLEILVTLTKHMFIKRTFGNVERPSDMDKGALMAYN